MKTRYVAALALVAATTALPMDLDAQVTVDSEIATAIVDRVPQGAGTSFPADVGRVYCWTLLTGAEDVTVQHVWIYGEMQFPVNLEVGGSPWRTWSSKSIPPEWSGEWRVEIRDGDGNLLDTRAFTVGS